MTAEAATPTAIPAATIHSAQVFVPILNILLGVAMIVGGASGRLALFGTGSGTALMVVGGVCAAIGVYQLIRAARAR